MKHYQNLTRLFLLTTAVCGLLLLLPKTASALSGSDFNAANIIDDGTFFNKNTMNTGDIQNFLNAKVPNCDTNGAQPSGRSGYPTRADWGRANGAPPPYTCLKDFDQAFDSKPADAYCGGISGGHKSAANIIFDVAQACGLNPQSLIVLLQKEQALVTDEWPWPVQYRSATGYGCPDSAPCDAQYYGFFNQVYNAARQTQRYVKQPGSFNYAAGRNSFILYNPNSNCGGTNMTIQNPATAALYNYTPYQPNQAALNNLYGTGDSCSAYGNRNFWRMFNDWFGPTSGNGFVLAKSDNSNDLRQWVIYGNIKQHVPDSQTIHAWGLQNVTLNTMTADYLASIPTGPNLDRLMRMNTDNGILYFVDNGKRYVVSRTNMLDAWNIGGMVTSYVSRDLFNIPADGGYISYSVKGPSASTIYMVDGANGNGQTVLRPYGSEQVFRAWEGDTAFYTELSNDFFDRINDAVGSTLSHTKVAFGGNEYQIVNGNRMSQPIAYASLYPGVAQAVSSATFNRLVPFAQVSYIVRSKSSPALYLIDNGQKHHIPWPDLLAAWAHPSAGYHILDDAYVNLIPNGSNISGYLADNGSQLYVMNGNKVSVPSALDAAYRQSSTIQTVSTTLLNLFPAASTPASGFIKGRSAPQVYLLDNSGKRRHIEWSDKLVLLAGANPVITTVSDSLISDIGTAASPGIFVTDGTNEYVFDGGKKVQVSSSIKTDWSLSNPQLYNDGTLSRFEGGGTLDNKLKGGQGFFLIRGGTAYVTGDSNIAKAWGLDGAVERNPQLVSSLLRSFMLTRFVRSSVSGDNRIFAVANGNWYTLSNAHLVNLGGQNVPIMQLDPSFAPNSITEWPSVIIKASDNTLYVVDGGGKRNFPHQMIRDQWTNFGNISAITVDDGFLNLLPYRGTVERTIKGSSPSVFSAETGHKRHIQYPDTYHRYHAPYSSVSDVLLDAMPDGPPI